MEWRKSSRSHAGSNCVEVRQDLAALRDSKRPGGELPITVSALRDLLARVR
ncbi:DUF397 domain-containing protein [Actinokineospora sp. UTMC 2448]|uniref:DUF397 domain-containing protein n=1 Tax=Actinokineospora sp. UTMC 2448 TaxID=2268449 RepID=UPI0021646C67|nr:DUF397 domain-containing protein [Actinokineospora sp. UTMC 2448]UVS81903.1 hypothetical protein Actkin_05667 [Actinokineospora sp. UTMC 2448]